MFKKIFLWDLKLTIYDYFPTCGKQLGSRDGDYWELCLNKNLCVFFFPRKSAHLLNICKQMVALVVKNLPSNAGYVRDKSLIPELGRSSGAGHGNPLQYSCLENPTDKGAWWATVHRVAKSQTQLKQFSMYTCQKPLFRYHILLLIF